ncbi:MAG: sterol desaturase family protein [Actinobacteria bacterium]|nr:sterol desaturase family protein [Actinomycetota bacterium]
MTAAFAVIVAFAAMEPVSYATHRWLMHGPGIGWHRSHHAPSAGRLERNDWFPVCFAAAGVGLFSVASVWSRPLLFWVAVGVTAYGAAYLFLHEICIHRRFGGPRPSGRYVEWVRDAHRVHHVRGEEPYGMLLPLVPGSEARRAAREAAPEALDRAATNRRTRAARARL